MTRITKRERDEPTIDPDLTDADPPEDYARHSTLAVRRLEVADRRVVVKLATGRTRAPLRAEAGILRLISPQLAPQVLALREHDDRTDLVLEDVGRPITDHLAHLDAADRLRMLARCARALDQLHGAGWSHGALCAEHVVLDEKQRPRFVSLGSARLLTETAGSADDLRQLLELVRLVAAAPMTGVRPWRWRRVRRELGRLADTPPPELHSASELAAALERISVPRAWRRPVRWLGLPDRAHGDWRRRLVTVVSVLAMVTLTAMVAPRLWGLSTASGVQADAVEPLRGGCAPVKVGPAGLNEDVRLDLTGDGCADLVHIDDTVLEVNGVPYRVGLPGDRVTLAYDDCDGTAQVQLLRPATGERFVFDRLATANAPAEARLVPQRAATAEPASTDPAEDSDDRRCEGAALSPSHSTISTEDPP